jgi:hypothetical protein
MTSESSEMPLHRQTQLATVAFLLARIPLLAHRVFDPDELEHSHAAWCLFKGMLPYRDFFEHHTPWYYYALRPFLNWFDVDGSFESARHFLLLGRGLSFVLTALSIFLVFRIGRLWEDRNVGAVAALLLAAQPVFLQKTLEMRPDVLALPFLLGCLWCLLRGLGPSAGSPPRRLWCFAGGGLGLGIAVMCTQKMLFVLPGALVGLGLWALAADRRARLLLVVAFVAGVCLPGIATWAGFALHHAGGVFIENNFLLNAHWKDTPTGQLLKLIRTSAPVLILSLLGLAATRPRDPRAVLLLSTLLGLFAGLLVIPVAQRQYYLMPLPIICLFAAKALLSLVARARQRARGPALVVSMVLLSALPVFALVEAWRSRNDDQLARLRGVFETTQRTDLVMDGWEGTGVFRPHAFYYFFIHDELLPMLPRSRVDAFLEALESGKVRPKLIALDQHLVALGPRFLAFVKSRYESHDGFLYFSKG